MLFGHSDKRNAAFLLIGCGLLAYLLFRLGPRDILALLLRIGWNFPLILAIYGAYTLLRASTLSRCIAAEKHSSDYWDLVRIRLRGEAVQYLTFTGPFLAEPAKALLLRNRGLRATQAFAATISEYLIYTFTSAAMALAGLIYLLDNFNVPRAGVIAAWIVIWIAGAFLTASAVAIATRFYLIGTIINAARSLPGIGRFIRIDKQALRDTEDLLFEVLRARPGRFLVILALELVAQALLVTELFVLLRAIGENAPLSRPFLIESATKFIGVAFFFIPGQAGAAEAVYALIFKALGLSATAGFSLALARRLRSVVIAAAGLFFPAHTGEPNLQPP